MSKTAGDKALKKIENIVNELSPEERKNVVFTMVVGHTMSWGHADDTPVPLDERFAQLNHEIDQVKEFVRSEHAKQMLMQGIGEEIDAAYEAVRQSQKGI